LAETFPTPRKKEEVPLWLYLSSQITLRLHGARGFSSLPYILHCGGLREALEEGQVQRKEDPSTKDVWVSFKGYNEKNSYDRLTPCDQDFVRKLARDTSPRALEAWYGREVARYLERQGAYDSEGIFIADGSYLFVPDNERYEGSRVALFDEHNHPISKEDREKLSASEKRRARYRRYYEMVSLCHTNRAKDYLVYAGGKVFTEGNEVQHLEPMVREFVEAVGPGVMKTLLIDRGFIDGASIGRIKRDYGVDTVIPLKAKMLITLDAWKLAEVDRKPWKVWEPPARERPKDPPQRPERIRRAEKKRQKTIAELKKGQGKKDPLHVVKVELKVIPEMRLWDECGVPLDVVLMRKHMSDGEVVQWGLMTTRRVTDPLEIRDLYDIRPACEEGWRQTKCYWDLTGFRSASFPLIVSQVIFVLLAYSLLQVFLLRSERGELAKATRQRLLAELLPDGDKVAVYYQNRVGYFTVGEYTQILLALSEGPRRRLQGIVRRLTKAQTEPPALPRRPEPA
jgi:Transposase DDE domain